MGLEWNVTGTWYPEGGVRSEEEELASENVG